MVREARHSVPPLGAGQVSSVQYAALARDARFRRLKARYAGLAAAMVAMFLGWYLMYVLMSVFARGVMALRVIGNINVALLLGVLQFASTFLLTWVYARVTRRMIDPLAAQIRGQCGYGPVPRPMHRRPGGRRRTRPAAPPPIPPPPRGLDYGPSMRLGGLR